MASTISTAGIAPGEIIDSDQVLRIIEALSGVADNIILLSGSLGVTGSAEFLSVVQLYAGATGSLHGTSSWAVSASWAPTGAGTGSLITTASFSSPVITFTKGDGSDFNIDLSTLVPATASYVLNLPPFISDPGLGRVILSDGTPNAATASANLIYTGSTLFVTGSTVLEAGNGVTNVLTAKSASVLFINVDTGSKVDVYSSLFNVRRPSNQQPVLTVSESIVQFTTQSTNPTGTAPAGGFWFTPTDLYLGLE